MRRIFQDHNPWLLLGLAGTCLWVAAIVVMIAAFVIGLVLFGKPVPEDSLPMYLMTGSLIAAVVGMVTAVTGGCLGDRSKGNAQKKQ